ncbi:MAG: PRC-barrel domain-containing protein, partial [Pseudomonadota bacterium]
ATSFDVAVKMSDIKMVSDGEAADEFFLVLKTNKEMLEKSEAYERTAAAATNVNMNTTETAAVENKSMDNLDNTTTGSIDKADANLDGAGREMLIRPQITGDGYMDAKPEELTAEMLTGARVYGTQDQDIGEVGELLLNGENQIDRLVLDIGGFIGLAEHHVAVTMEEVQVIRGADGSDVRVYVNATQAQLERQPEYEG